MVVAWIDAESEERILAGWELLAESLHIYPLHGGVVDAVRAYLEGMMVPSILVFDNIVDPDVVMCRLPRHGLTKLIFTTTNRAFGDIANIIEVGLFEYEESLNYLRKRTGYLDEPGDLDLVSELDRLPLALAHAAALIRREKISYKTYLERLRTFPIVQYLPRHPGDPYPQGTAQAVLLSIATAEEADETGLTWALLSSLSILSSSSTARRLLHAIALEWTPQRTSIAASVDSTLGYLADDSILSLNSDGQSVSIHRVTGRVLRERSVDHTSRKTYTITTGPEHDRPRYASNPSPTD